MDVPHFAEIFESLAGVMGGAGPNNEDDDEPQCTLRVEDFLACRTETAARALINAENYECRACGRSVDEHDRALFASDAMAESVSKAWTIVVDWLEATYAPASAPNVADSVASAPIVPASAEDGPAEDNPEE